MYLRFLPAILAGTATSTTTLAPESAGATIIKATSVMEGTTWETAGLLAVTAAPTKGLAALLTVLRVTPRVMEVVGADILAAQMAS